MSQSLMVLEPRTPAVSTSGRAADLFFRSDTLSAALTSVLAWLGEPVDGEGRLAEGPPFRVGSAVPLLREEGGRISVFYPVPDACKTRHVEGLDRKALKQVLYADGEWLGAILKARRPRQGRTISEEHAELVLRKWPERTPRTLAATGIRTGLAVDRWTGGPIESLLFEVTDVFVVEKSFRIGVIVECEDASRERLSEAFRILGLCGIGSRRTTGRGQFEVEEVCAHVPPELGRGFHLLLSLYHPTKQEADAGILRQSWYRLEQRGGFVTSPGAMMLRRRRLTMLSEGSLVGGDRPPQGEVVLVLDPSHDPAPGLRHPVYRDGRAVSVPVGFEAR